ncbi:hypothetical protein [Enterobacter sp. ENT03]|uniref:hypothetical protein n=1 Tax=Enterobacter sp. ENT03 TaxID=2854780 RepID=UPI001C469CB6|nr:hypothetical protein [Enterobacter sp. ENT03]MBV7404024.1 hypothetical protein [Enterobacter sp. ENT03]
MSGVSFFLIDLSVALAISDKKVTTHFVRLPTKTKNLSGLFPVIAAFHGMIAPDKYSAVKGTPHA